jgi:peptidoglycan/xylan/chitin deacetylase (PgdA/CDA1 family)
MAKQLGVLRTRGYVGFTLSELVSRRDEGTLPKRSLAVTFDDGYASTLKAKPILDDAGYPATVFVVTDFVESGELLSWPGIEQWRRGAQSGELASLRHADLELLTEAGWEIGSHTRSHPSLPTLSRERLADEIGGSREQLIRRLGRCDTLAYPYGLTSADAIDVVESSGYSAACVVTPRGGEQGRFCVPRVGLYGNDTGWRLRAKLSPRVYAVSRRRARARARR